jgi:hypothetical protein
MRFFILGPLEENSSQGAMQRKIGLAVAALHCARRLVTVAEQLIMQQASGNWVLI